MALGSWRVAAIIEIDSSRFTRGMDAVMRSTVRASEQIKLQQGLITKNEILMQKYQRVLNDARAAQMRFGTMAAGYGFAAIGAGLARAVVEAAKFERAMTGVQIATGATAKQYKMLSDMAMSVSASTAQNATTIAQELFEAARVAQHRPEDLVKIFPQMAKYADVRYIAHGEDPVKTIEYMSQFSHFFQAYGPGAMSRMLDNAAKLQMTTSAELPQLVRQGKYFIPSSLNAGVSEDTIFKYLSVMAQGGFLSGRGGTSMENVVQRLSSMSQYGHMSKNMVAAVNDLGLVDANRNLKGRFLDSKGTLQMIPFVQYLMEKREESNLGNFLKQNPDFAIKAFRGIALFGAALGVRFVVGVASATAGIWRLSAAIDALAVSTGVGAAGGAAGGAAAGGAAGGAAAGGVLGRFKGIFGLLDGVLLAGLGGKMIGGVKGGYGLFSKLTTTVLDGFSAAIGGWAAIIKKGFDSWRKFAGDELTQALDSVRQDIVNVFKKIPLNLFKGFGTNGLEAIFGRIGPWFVKFPGWLTDIVRAIEGFSPKFLAFADAFGGVLGLILMSLTRFLAAIPGLDIAALVLTPTSAGDDSAWVAAHPERGGQVRITDFHLHLHGDPKDAGRKTFEFLTGLGANAQSTLAKGRTSPTLPTSRSVFAPAR